MTKPVARGQHRPNSGPGTRPDRVRPSQVAHDLAVKAEPLRCGVCGNPSEHPVCRKCSPLVEGVRRAAC